ncbi:MAG TPA: translation initiation factor [Candidatus Binatia bacterium]|nr:translation initiation factor [Candidatus Binatia bacterium]
MAKSKEAPPSPSPSPFGKLPGLDALRDKLPPSPANADRPSPAAPPPRPSIFARSSKVVVRRERKGHGGKTVTRIEGLDGSTAELEAVARELKTAFGCGASVEERDVLLQGDHGQRLVAVLQKRGVRHVVEGG